MTIIIIREAMILRMMMKKQVNLIKVYNLLGDKQPQKKKYTFTYDPNLFGLDKPKSDSKSEQNK